MGQDPDIAVAIDGMSLDEGIDLVERLGSECTWVKVGLELFTAAGPDAVRQFKARDKRVFLDLKLHDIPNTVGGAVRAVASLEADLLTVHASGGTDMVRAARDVSDEQGGRTRIVAVTIPRVATRSIHWSIACDITQGPGKKLASQLNRFPRSTMISGSPLIRDSPLRSQSRLLEIRFIP